jgi:TolB protein
MTARHRPLLLLLATALGLAFAPVEGRARAADPSPAPTTTGEPNEDLLGTVEVNGSAEGLPPLPKMSVVPLMTSGVADSIVNLVVRRDMELSGQFDVLDDAVAPSGPFTHTTPLDLGAWRVKGAEYVLRVFAEPAPNDSIRTQLVGEAFLTPTQASASSNAASDPKPALRSVVTTATTEVRAASHRLVDQLLGGLTGRPGGFASQMVYAERVGRWRRVFTVDADGFDLRAIGPENATALSPAFGPGGQIYYALSRNYEPFRLVVGADATPISLPIPGSILGVAFSPDRSRTALTVMTEGRSELWSGDLTNLKAVDTPPLTNHPVFGPLGKMAYVAGSPVQRIYVDGKPISPQGFMASAPVFCDTPQGLLVLYTVGVGAGADIVASDTTGGGIRRLTQHEGANTYAACSPDGRLVAFFSTGKRKRSDSAASPVQEAGAGLFVMPIARPWLAKKVSTEVGESLRWEPVAPSLGK